MKTKDIDITELRKFVNDVYDFDDDVEPYYPTNRSLRDGLIRNLATFLFDNSSFRYALKTRIPKETYIKVLEALCDGNHDT